MITIDMMLKAKNSSGEQKLSLIKDEGEYWFVLSGVYKGKPIQIDFEEMSRGELIDIRNAIIGILG